MLSRKIYTEQDIIPYSLFLSPSCLEKNIIIIISSIFYYLVVYYNRAS